MKTDSLSRIVQTEKRDSKVLSETKIVKGARRTLQPLQKAAGDKENLVGAGRTPSKLPSGMPPIQDVSVVIKDIKSTKNLKPSKTPENKSVITAEDLTSEDGPSEKYWEILAERRGDALATALQENEELHKRVRLLEEENSQCKVLLEETKNLVETLTEVLNDKTEYDDDEEEELVVEEHDEQ